MIRGITEDPGWYTRRIDGTDLQLIAEDLRDRIAKKNYPKGQRFNASDIVGKGQVVWSETPLRAIEQHYPTENAQSAILGRILKKTLYDIRNEWYGMERGGFSAIYWRI